MKNETKEKDILCKLTQAFLIGKKNHYSGVVKETFHKIN